MTSVEEDASAILLENESQGVSSSSSSSGSTSTTSTFLVPDTAAVESEKVKVVYLTPDPGNKKTNWLGFGLLVGFFIGLIVVMTLCIVFLAPQTPYNLGDSVCCSPKNILLGQRLQNGNFYLKLDDAGSLSLYQQDPENSSVVDLIWTTPTQNLSVSYAYLNPDGTLNLINSNGGIVWSTPIPSQGGGSAIPVSPYSLNLSEIGTTTITSANGIDVWTKTASGQEST